MKYRFQGQLPVATSGDEYRFKCPFCVKKAKTPDEKGHLYVNLDKKVYHCFRCGAKGSTKTNVEEYSTSTLEEAINTLRYQVLEEPQPEVDYPCDVVPIVPTTLPWVYLTNRRVSEESIRRHKMSDGYYAGAFRIFIPVFDSTGRMVFWVARAYQDVSDNAPKYMTPKGGTKNILFNLPGAREHDTIIITEGVFSALAAGPNAVATFGKQLTAYQLELLVSYAWKEYVIALDPDAKDEAHNLAVYLIMGTGAKVSVVNFPEGEDPASVDSFSEWYDLREEVTLASLIEKQFEKGT